MKNVTFKHASMILLIAVFSSLGLSSCKKDDDSEMQPRQNIAAVVVANSNFSLLKAALVRANLVTTLEGTGPFTVFAPTNEAFAAAGFDTEAKINAAPVETLRNILLYHVVAQSIPSASIPTATNTAVNTASDKNVYVTKNSNGVFVNGATVTQADIMATNGYIHVINKVLMPPSNNIVAAAQANSNFSFLVAAVLRASQGSTNVASVLSGAGPLTVFAPTNQAFIDAGFSSVAAIQAADPAQLTAILTYHVLPGRVFSTDLVNNSKPQTVNGATLTVSLTGGAKVKGNGNTMASTITASDMVTTNGVIHVIDRVLLP